MRTNIEDDVITSGRLGAFMRAAKLLDSTLPAAVKDELMAMGALVFTYRDSQVKRFTTGERARLRSILAVRLGDAADQVIDALISADLARPKGNKISVKGNPKQVTRLRSFRSNASKGGKIRAEIATRQEDGTFGPSKHQQPPAESSAPNSDLLSPSPVSLKEKPEDPPLSVLEKASEEFDDCGDEPKPKKPRSTRGFIESAFEAEFIERGFGVAITVAKFDHLELAIGGQLVIRCGENKITQAQLLDEWWHPAWRIWHGFDVRALDKHFAKVRAAIADPKQRPKIQAAAPEPPRARPPNAEESERKLREEREAIEKAPQVDDEEAARRFAEMRRRGGL